MHPAVRARAAELERAADAAAVVVHVIPLLVETGQQQDFDLVVTVDVDHETQIQRLMARNGLQPRGGRVQDRRSGQSGRSQDGG